MPKNSKHSYFLLGSSIDFVLVVNVPVHAQISICRFLSQAWGGNSTIHQKCVVAGDFRLHRTVRHGFRQSY